MNFIKSIINAYSSVLFSSRYTVGIIIILATFVSPAIGFAGLLGTAWAIFVSRILSFDTKQSTSGIFGFNSMLTSLGVGFFLAQTHFSYATFIGVILVSSTLTLLLYISINSICYSLFKMPSMSIAFSVVAVLMSFFYLRLGGYTFYAVGQSSLFNFEPNMPTYWLMYFKSLGSIFFQTSFVAGFAIAIALLIATRIGFLLSLLGYTICYYFITSIPEAGLSEISYIGLNGILVSIAIGGIFIIPSKNSFLLAGLATVLSVVITLALRSLFFLYYIPPFAFPFNITVIAFTFALGHRLKNSNPYLVDFAINSPEQNLDYFVSKVTRFYQAGIPQFYLPFTGTWKITQGNFGDITHKLHWAYAWDFEVFDQDNKNYKTDGKIPDDYYAFRKPVLASADGLVVKIIDGIADNPINQINTRENWGNLVVIKHTGGIYSMYCHLKKNSVKVHENDYIYKGQKIGVVGNSGRSSVPHLHFNIQLGPEPGSHTLKSQLVNFKIPKNENEDVFYSKGVPENKQSIAPLTPCYHLQDIMNLKVEDTAKFKVNVNNKTFEETWKVEVDLLGKLTIKSNQNSVLEFSVYDGIYNCLDFSGNRKTALFAFAAGLSRLPYLQKGSLSFVDTPAISAYLPPLLENLALFVYPIVKAVKIKNLTTIQTTNESIKIESTSRVNALKAKLKSFKANLKIKPYFGVTELNLKIDEKHFLNASRIDKKETEK